MAGEGGGGGEQNKDGGVYGLYIKRIFNESGADLGCARGAYEVHTGCRAWDDGGAENEDGGGGGAGRRGGGAK